jgi:hypothetical protein
MMQVRCCQVPSSALQVSRGSSQSLCEVVTLYVHEYSQLLTAGGTGVRGTWDPRVRPGGGDNSTWCQADILELMAAAK